MIVSKGELILIIIIITLAIKIFPKLYKLIEKIKSPIKTFYMYSYVTKII